MREEPPAAGRMGRRVGCGEKCHTRPKRPVRPLVFPVRLGEATSTAAMHSRHRRGGAGGIVTLREMVLRFVEPENGDAARISGEDS